MIRAALAVITIVLAGCASWSSFWRPSAALLERADRLVTEGKYPDALDAYDQILAKYPESDDARRALSSHETLAGLVAARAQITRLTTELARARGLATARENELKRARQEILRLTEETERLRADLEQLKRIDIDLERRRK